MFTTLRKDMICRRNIHVLFYVCQRDNLCIDNTPKRLRISIRIGNVLLFAFYANNAHKLVRFARKYTHISVIFTFIDSSSHSSMMML